MESRSGKRRARVRFAAVVGATLALGALGLAGACRQVLGVEERTAGFAALELGADCDACVARECREAERACAAEPECVALVGCMANGPTGVAKAGEPTPVERAQCATDHPGGLTVASFEAMDQCMRAPCQDACFDGPGFFWAYESDCQDCMTDACLAETKACVADPGCDRVATSMFSDPEG